MGLTVILTLLMCILLFLMIWSAAFFLPWRKLMDFFPEDIREKAIDHKPPFRMAPVIGWICMIVCMLGFAMVIVYGGWDGVQKNYTFLQHLVRFLIILFGVKAFDIIALDYILITKTHFFQHYLPETEGCAGYQDFGFNRREQIRQIIMLPFAALLTAWICSLF